VGAAVNGPLISAATTTDLKPYITLARRLGELAVQWDAGPLRRLELRLAGNLAALNCAPLTASALAAVLDQVLDVRVNLVNARLIAEQRGLHVEEGADEGDQPFRGALSLHLQRDDRHFVTLHGTIVHDEPRLTAINDFPVELPLTPGIWLCTRHDDRPGLIGELGSLLGAHNINIGFMQLGRDQPRGMALMIVGVDDPIDPELLGRIEALPAVKSARVVTVR